MGAMTASADAGGSVWLVVGEGVGDGAGEADEGATDVVDGCVVGCTEPAEELQALTIAASAPTATTQRALRLIDPD
jgi:hypothetical protein